MGKALKGWISYQQLIEKYSNAPQINLLIVGSPLNHFWGQVVQSPTHCLSPQRWCMHRPAEVCNEVSSLLRQHAIVNCIKMFLVSDPNSKKKVFSYSKNSRPRWVPAFIKQLGYITKDQVILPISLHNQVHSACQLIFPIFRGWP